MNLFKKIMLLAICISTLAKPSEAYAGLIEKDHNYYAIVYVSDNTREDRESYIVEVIDMAKGMAKSRVKGLYKDALPGSPEKIKIGNTILSLPDSPSDMESLLVFSGFSVVSNFYTQSEILDDIIGAANRRVDEFEVLYRRLQSLYNDTLSLGRSLIKDVIARKPAKESSS